MGGGLQGAIETDAVAKAPSEEIADWGLKDASGEVPKRDFNSTCGGGGHATHRASATAHQEHLMVQLIDVQRIFADDERLQLGQDEVLDPRAPVGFANCGDAGVSLDLDEVPGPRSTHDHALDFGDLDLLAERLRKRTVWFGEQIGTGGEML